MAKNEELVLEQLIKRMKFHPKDVLQVIVGAAILAVPVGFTEETWQLGESLPLGNILWLMALSLIFIGSFVYYHYHKNGLKNGRYHAREFTKRVISTYVLSFIVVALLLMIIQRAPWMTDTLVAFKRTVIVAFPSSMSAAVADMLK